MGKVLYNVAPAVELVLEELEKATTAHKPWSSEHHGYAIIHEELDELWDEVKKREPDKDRMKEEAVQVAAMAIRFLIDICEVDGND